MSTTYFVNSPVALNDQIHAVEQLVHRTGPRHPNATGLKAALESLKKLKKLQDALLLNPTPDADEISDLLLDCLDKLPDSAVE